MELKSKIEGLLFYKGEDITTKKIADIFGVSVDEVDQALIELQSSLSGHGIVVIRKNDSVALGVASELGPVIEDMRKDEISKELSKASLETLSIIIYKNGVTRSEVDYIRGVNSSFIIRNLLVRGLIEKITDEKDSRRMIYRPTFDTLSFMGVKSIEEVPNYTKVKAELDDVIKNRQSND